MLIASSSSKEIHKHDDEECEHDLRRETKVVGKRDEVRVQRITRAYHVHEVIADPAARDGDEWRRRYAALQSGGDGSNNNKSSSSSSSSSGCGVCIPGDHVAHAVDGAVQRSASSCSARQCHRHLHTAPNASIQNPEPRKTTMHHRPRARALVQRGSRRNRTTTTTHRRSPSPCCRADGSDRGPPG